MRASLAIATLIGLALAALIGVAVSGAGEPPPAIRIGIASRPSHELLQFAAEKSLFAREGGSVQIVEFPEGGDARRAYERAQIDGLAGTLVDLAALRDGGARAPVAFAVLGFSRGADVLVARPGITATPDLRGRRVGIRPAASALVVLTRALAGAGLGLGDVQLVSVDLDCGPKALTEGRVDALVSHPPASVEIAQSGAGHVLFTSADVAGGIADVVMIDPAVLRENPRGAAAIVRALERATRRVAARPADAYRLMSRSEGLSAGEMREALEKGFERPAASSQAALLAPDGPLARALDAAAAALRESGGLGREPDLAGAFTTAVLELAGRG